MNQYRKIVKYKNRYREFVRILNGALQLTERELDVFSAFLAIDLEWPASQEAYKNILSTDSRKIVMAETTINKSNLTKYAKEFKLKGLLIEDEFGNTFVNSIFRPEESNNVFEVLFTLELNTQ